jgi:sugar O-acyltransferase (sialic acid O-acetyltransferase NeuD family)
MIDYVILGCSPAPVSTMLESVHRLHPEGARVRIVSNMAVKSDLPFAVDGVDLFEVTDHEWDYEEDFRCSVPFLCGVYRPPSKRILVSFFHDEHGIETDRYTNLIHPAAELATTVRLGVGVDVGPGVVVGPHAHIGNFVNLNRAATIGHHTSLGDFVSVNPAANIAGQCRIGEGVSVGIGATVIDGVEIGSRSVIGAGSVVTRDLPEAVVAVGVPARIVRTVE